MGSMSIWHWLVVLGIVLLLFGSRLPNVMGDLAKGIKNFKAGLKENDEDAAAEPARTLPKTSASVQADANVKTDESARG